MASISIEVAEAEFTRFVEAMDLDVDPAEMDAEDRESFKQAKRRIVGALLAGSLVVTEQGEPVFTPVASTNKDPITFYEPTGSVLMAADSAKKNHYMEKTLLMVVAMTRQDKSRFANMPHRDLKVCLSIAGLFLGG